MSEAKKEEDIVADKPHLRTESRVKTPDRRHPVKRRADGVHDEEPDLQVTILDDDDEMIEGGEILDINVMKFKQQDREIIYHAILGHDLAETYSSKRLQLTADREFLRQNMSTDVSVAFSPKRVTAVCKQYGLEPGEAMDIKNGSDFDLASDGKKAWDRNNHQG